MMNIHSFFSSLLCTLLLVWGSDIEERPAVGERRKCKSPVGINLNSEKLEVLLPSERVWRRRVRLAFIE